MQRPHNSPIHTSRPTSKHPAARIAWDYFVTHYPENKPCKLWFVRDTHPFCSWIMEWTDENGRVTHDEITSASLKSMKERGTCGGTVPATAPARVEFLDADGNVMAKEIVRDRKKGVEATIRKFMREFTWRNLQQEGKAPVGVLPSRTRFTDAEGIVQYETLWDGTIVTRNSRPVAPKTVALVP